MTGAHRYTATAQFGSGYMAPRVNPKRVVIKTPGCARFAQPNSRVIEIFAPEAMLSSIVPTELAVTGKKLDVKRDRSSASFVPHRLAINRDRNLALIDKKFDLIAIVTLPSFVLATHVAIMRTETLRSVATETLRLSSEQFFAI